MTRVYGKLLFSHPDKDLWEKFRKLGFALFKNELKELPDFSEKDDLDQCSNYKSEFEKTVKGFFNSLKKTYTFQKEMGLIEKTGRNDNE